MVEIPKTLFQIWIGDRAAPLDWMATWKKTHPDWEYKLIDNSAISQRRFRNQKLINEYIKFIERNQIKYIEIGFRFFDEIRTKGF